MKNLILFFCLAFTYSLFGQTSEKPLLSHGLFEQTSREIREAPQASVSERAKTVTLRYRMTSSQVRDLALLIPNEYQRLEFAMAAYDQIVDKHDFYQVYDTFTRYSIVFRLHDYVAKRPAPLPGGIIHPGVSEEDFAAILRAIRAESFENNKKKLATQIISSKKYLSSRQIRELLRLFDFEPSRLELAKYSFDYVADPENYFVVNEAFEFAHTKNNLTDYIMKKSSVESSR